MSFLNCAGIQALHGFSAQQDVIPYRPVPRKIEFHLTRRRAIINTANINQTVIQLETILPNQQGHHRICRVAIRTGKEQFRNSEIRLSQRFDPNVIDPGKIATGTQGGIFLIAPLQGVGFIQCSRHISIIQMPRQQHISGGPIHLAGDKCLLPGSAAIIDVKVKFVVNFAAHPPIVIKNKITALRHRELDFKVRDISVINNGTARRIQAVAGLVGDQAKEGKAFTEGCHQIATHAEGTARSALIQGFLKTDAPKGILRVVEKGHIVALARFTKGVVWIDHQANIPEIAHRQIGGNTENRK